MIRRPPRSPLFPYTPLSRSHETAPSHPPDRPPHRYARTPPAAAGRVPPAPPPSPPRYCSPTSRSPSRRYVSDRKSTRLNSSHLVISYAVFCLKKKKNNTTIL